MHTAAISHRYFLGDLLARETRNGMSCGDLHLLIDCRCPHVERTAEDEGKAKHIVDLVRVIRPPGRDDAVGAHGLGCRRGNLRVGIGHRENDWLPGHFFQERRGQRVLCRKPQEHVCAVECFFQCPCLGFRGVRRFPLIHAGFATLVDHALTVAHDDMVWPYPHRLDQGGAGDGGGTCAVDDDFDFSQRPPGKVDRIDEASGSDDRGAMLVVVHDRDLHPLL